MREYKLKNKAWGVWGVELFAALFSDNNRSGTRPRSTILLTPTKWSATGRPPKVPKL